MEKLRLLRFGMLLPLLASGLLLSVPSASAEPSATSSRLAVLDHFYGDYEVTGRDWRELPGIQIFSLSNGDPYLDLRPALDTIEHRGTLGLRLQPDGPFLGGTNPRIEFSGSSETGAYKKQEDYPILGNGPLAGYLHNPSVQFVNLSNLVNSRNSYTFTHYRREYSLDFKLNYELANQWLLTPSIGFVHSRLDQTHLVFFHGPNVEGYRLTTENVHNITYGLRTGFDLEVPVLEDWSLLFGSHWTIDYNDANLDVDEFDGGGTIYKTLDGDSRWSNTTDLTFGIQKRFNDWSVQLLGGVSFYSYMPRIANAIKSTDEDVHLEGQSSYSQQIKLTVSYRG